jgi:hypothetical protein
MLTFIFAQLADNERPTLSQHKREVITTITRIVVAQVKGDFLDHIGQKVKWDSVLKASSFCEMEGMRYRLTNTIIAVAGNGGYIAITIDRTVGLRSQLDTGAIERQEPSQPGGRTR